MESDEDPASIEKRLKRSITGILECNLATEQVFEPDVFSKKVDVMICSLVFDVICIDVNQLETAIKRALRFALFLC